VGDDYTVNEDVYATYAMTRADVGRLRVVAGLRYEHTALDASGTAIVLDGVVHKSIDAVIVRATVADEFDLTPFIGTVIVDDAAIIQPINGEDASILGAAARAVRRTADIEGVALRQSDTGALLVVSSQGDNSYAVYDTASRQHLVSFHVGGAGGPDDVSETDGLDVTAASLPGFPEGLLVVQDGYKPEANQNFKFVSWRDIATLLRPGTAAGGSPGSAL
jgi:hypothetical protein